MSRSAQMPLVWQPTGRLGTVALVLIAVLLCLSVLIINRGPLYYFDSGSYYKQGNAALSLVLPPPESAVGAGEDGAVGVPEKDNTTVGSRSMIYAVAVAAFWRAGAVTGVLLADLGGLLLAVWLAVRCVARSFPVPPPTGLLFAVPLAVAAAGSLPFYVAYLMPDLFAPVTLVVIALLAAAGREMRTAEILAALALGLLAVTMHPSHLAIAGLMIPLTALGALLVSRRRWWLPPLLVAVIFLGGVAERKLFEFMAQTVADREVTYTPHMTARLIVDGPGMDYLAENCPDPGIETCALYEALSWSDDPYRLTVSHINFETSERLGSFRLLPPETREKVAAEQREFFLDVLASRPLATTLAFAKNTLQQFAYFRINMTIPDEDVMASVREQTGKDWLEGGPLSESRDWIAPLSTAQAVLYALSLAVAVLILVRPGRIPGPVRVFAVFVLLGMLVNAFVCGAVSQPADRYGARVIWLLPYLAALLALSRISAARAPGAAASSSGITP